MVNDDKIIAAHLGDDNEFFGAVVPPVFMNSLHVFENMQDYLECDKYNDFIYGRVSNPTAKTLEKKLAALENAKHAAVFASGMAACTSAIMAVCKAGSHIISLENCYGPTRTFIDNVCVKKLGMSVTYVKAQEEDIINAIKDETDIILLESPTSLIFEIIDLEAVAKAAKEKHCYTYIDNSYCSPIFQKPINFGIDIVMHTMSKYIGGHSDIIGGVLMVNNDELYKEILEMRELYGGIIGPQEAWLAMRGLRTMEVKIRSHMETALKVAEFLEKHPKVKRVYYPWLNTHPKSDTAKKQQSGCSGLLSFEIYDDKEQAAEVCNRLKLFKIGVSWGGFESLVVMPAYKYTQEQSTTRDVPNNLIRIHCGLEGTENLIKDLENALDY